jgi:hypothetical protein
VDNNYLDFGMNKSGFVHTLPVAGLMWHGHLSFIFIFIFYLKQVTHSVGRAKAPKATEPAGHLHQLQVC